MFLCTSHIKEKDKSIKTNIIKDDLFDSFETISYRRKTGRHSPTEPDLIFFSSYSLAYAFS